MKRITLTLILAMLFAAAGPVLAEETTPQDKPTAPYTKNLEEALARGAKEQKPVLVDFYSDT